MRIKNKLSLLFVSVFVGVMLLFVGLLYYSYNYYKDVGKLGNTIIFTSIFSIVLIVVASRLLANQFIKPIKKIIRRVEEITASNLHLRVEVENNQDEIEELATTFNQMLDRLEHSFGSQKQFVSNISHELRTPLSAITTELELASLKERSTEEYKKVISLALNDARKLTRLSNGLLDLAKANYDQREIKFKEVRLDELLLDVRQSVQKTNPEYKVNIIFEREIENDDYISVMGNEYLLKVAFLNLMENACKFSEDKQAAVSISFFKGHTILKFADTGIGIPEGDLEHIFTPFYRGSNKQYADGNGIGLSLTQIIIALHKGKISVASQVNEGTTFTVELHHV